MLCVCAHKEKRLLVVFLCGFPGKNKPNYIQIPSCPSLPSLGAFSVMQGVGCWTNPVQRNTPSSGNHHHGCTTSWQEERNDQQKNINRWWKAAWISCLNKQSEERGTTVRRGVCLCALCMRLRECHCVSCVMQSLSDRSSFMCCIPDSWCVLPIKIPLLFHVRYLLTHSAAH